MKNCIKLLILALMFSGCSKLTDVLNIDPPNNLDQNNAVTTAEGAQNILKGVHAQLHNQYYYLHPEWVPSIMTGTMDRGSTLVNIQFVNNEVLPELIDVRHVFNAFYSMVNHANWAIELIRDLPADVIPETEKNQLIGQAKGLRAMAHFDVLRYYGQFYDSASKYGIVLRTEPANFTTRVKARGTVAEAYELILEDLDEAIAQAPDFQKSVLFSKTAAKAFKARVLLYKGDHAAAAALADEVITDNTRTLSPTFAQVFSTGFASTEMIFMRATDAVTAAQNERKRFTYDNRGAIAGAFLRSLLTGDPRQPATYTAANNTIVKVNNTTFNKPTYLVRLAEMYLIKAEGLARSGAPLADAKAPLETIMSRAWGEPHTAAATSNEELLDEIYTEIIKELSFENGSDWFASLRFGKISEVKPSVTRISQYILPIPEAEITSNYLFGEQNPGY